MLIAVSEGEAWRYEVDENVDGYVVLQRDLATGEEIAARLFKTAPAAFAYADLAAAQERCRGPHDAFDEVSLRLSRARFAQTRQRLADEGVAGSLLEAWRRADAQEHCIRFH